MGTLKMGDQVEASPEKKEGEENVEKTEVTEDKEATDDGAPKEGGEEEEEEEPIIDLSNYFVKPDQFEGIHILDAKFEKVAGAPNFRQLPGFPVFGTGQPTEAGMVEILKRAKGEKESAKVIWFTVRQEPVVYVNGSPYAPRAPDAPHAQMETKLDKAELDSVCVHLANVLKKRLKNSEDASKLEQLREIMADPNYKDNLSSLIRTIYDFAYLTYADLPRGQIKNNSMKKLAATTLMDILPQELSEKITKKIDEDPNCSHDFLTIVGMVSYF